MCSGMGYEHRQQAENERQKGEKDMPQYRPYGQTRAVCGYYLRDSRLCISCVSAAETSQAMMMRFDSEAAKCRYMERHCFCRGSGACAQARLLHSQRQ